MILSNSLFVFQDTLGGNWSIKRFDHKQ